MQGLVLYNGSSKTAKVQNAALKVLDELQKRNFKMQSIKNDEILNLIDADNDVNLVLPKYIEKPNFLVAWDKDVKLIQSFEKMGVRAFNKSCSIEACDNKALMHTQLINSGIRIPKTIICPLVFMRYEFTKEYYDRVVEQLGESFILKEDNGSFGMQVYNINSFEQFIDITRSLFNRGFIMQENIKTSKGRDLRVSIVGDEVIGVMLRTNPNDFRANITLGGEAKMFEAPKEVKDLALKVHKTLGLDFSGVDILFGENEEPILCEVNSNPNFFSFENASGINFAGLIADYIIGELKCME